MQFSHILTGKLGIMQELFVENVEKGTESIGGLSPILPVQRPVLHGLGDLLLANVVKAV